MIFSTIIVREQGLVGGVFAAFGLGIAFSKAFTLEQWRTRGILTLAAAVAVDCSVWAAHVRTTYWDMAVTSPFPPPLNQGYTQTVTRLMVLDLGSQPNNPCAHSLVSGDTRDDCQQYVTSLVLTFGSAITLAVLMVASMIVYVLALCCWSDRDSTVHQYKSMVSGTSDSAHTSLMGGGRRSPSMSIPGSHKSSGGSGTRRSDRSGTASTTVSSGYRTVHRVLPSPHAYDPPFRSPGTGSSFEDAGFQPHAAGYGTSLFSPVPSITVVVTGTSSSGRP